MSAPCSPGRRTATLDAVRAQLGSSLDGWLRWLGALPAFIRGDGYILVHAGIAPGRRPEDCTLEELTEIRAVDGKPWFESWRGPEPVIERNRFAVEGVGPDREAVRGPESLPSA